MNEWLKDNLACPQDKQKVNLEGNHLICPRGHRYPVIEDVPVMLFDDGSPTHGYITKTLEKVARIENGEMLENVIVTGENRSDEIDDFVQKEVPYTCGTLYFSVQNRLTRYPFPEFRLPDGTGKRFLDVGCNWGRWTITAAKNDYLPVGIDPSLDACLAGRRIAKQLKTDALFVVADARFLPFADDSFDISFSYSVLQHLKKINAKTSLDEMARVTKTGGEVVVQMPNKYGIRSFYHQAKRGFGEAAEGGEVFYYTPAELTEIFTKTFGETEMSVDCYFGLGIQKNDADLLPLHYKMIVHTSEALRGLSKKLPFMTKVADSVYLHSKNQKIHNKK
jgi:ubiquinone/menaquinone biosynthesis C-methylase UbiE/uncharacterized protein YbaR (Trm112 family)